VVPEGNGLKPNDSPSEIVLKGRPIDGVHRTQDARTWDAPIAVFQDPLSRTKVNLALSHAPQVACTCGKLAHDVGICPTHDCEGRNHATAKTVEHGGAPGALCTPVLSTLSSTKTIDWPRSEEKEER
jgi:hypothetical protein